MKQITITVPSFNARRAWEFARKWLLPNPGTLIVLLLFALAIPTLARVAVAPNAASITTIPYQGRLADASGNPVTGKQNMEFRLYNSPTATTPLWTEYWTGANAVDVSDGLFSVMLGSISTNLTSVVQANSNLFLGITVGTDNEMTPRVQLGSVPFSIWSLSVADGSVTEIKIANGAVTTSKLSDNAVTSAKIADGAVTTADFADSGVTTAKIADNAVTSAKIADGSVNTGDLADNAVTGAKIADNAVGSSEIANGSVSVSKLEAMTGIVWKAPPYTTSQGGIWSPTQNAEWDISAFLTEAGVPANAEMILLGWRPSLISDISAFTFLDANGNTLGTIVLGTSLKDNTYSPVGPEYGSPIPVPGATRKIKYSAVGAYTQDSANPRRVLVIYGWK